MWYRFEQNQKKKHGTFQWHCRINSKSTLHLYVRLYFISTKKFRSILKKKIFRKKINKQIKPRRFILFETRKLQRTNTPPSRTGILQKNRLPVGRGHYLFYDTWGHRRLFFIWFLLLRSSTAAPTSLRVHYSLEGAVC